MTLYVPNQTNFIVFQVDRNMFIPSLRGRYLKRRGEKEPARCFPAPLTPTKPANMQTFLFFQKKSSLILFKFICKSFTCLLDCISLFEVDSIGIAYPFCFRSRDVLNGYFILSLSNLCIYIPVNRVK